MRLHLTERAWAANWAASDGPTPGDCHFLPPDAGDDWPHRILCALADALAWHSADCDHLPPEVTVCLPRSLLWRVKDFPARLQAGPWRSETAARMAAEIHRRRIVVRLVPSTAREQAWMRTSEAVATQGLISGGVLGAVAL
jgi:hypothetical protein